MSGKILARASAVSLALILAACGGDDASTSLAGVDGGGTGGGGTGGGGTGGGTTDEQEAILELGTGSGDSFQSGAITLSATELSSGGSSRLEFNVVDANDGYEIYGAEETTVTLTSQCEAATLDSPITTTSGRVSTTYEAGCPGSDTITARLDNGAIATVNLTVAQQEVGALEFVMATPPAIATLGSADSARASVSEVIFRVVDRVGQPVIGQEVSFTLSTTVGGISITETEAETNSAGEAKTRVNAGTVSTVVSITATTDVDDETIQTTSDPVSISAAIPDHDSFSISIAENFLPNARFYDGVEVPINVRAADRNNNNVNDTVVNFATSGGAIPNECFIEQGVCTVNWISQDPRQPDNGIIAVLARTVGEESFRDLNSDGIYTAGVDRFSTAEHDAGEAFLDRSYNGLRGADEEYFDYNQNGSYDAADGIYNGTACSTASEDVGDCTNQIKEIFELIYIYATSDFITIEATTPISAPGDICFDIAGEFTDSDGNTVKGPPPGGTSVEFETTNGEIIGESSYNTTTEFRTTPVNVCIFTEADDTPDSGTLTITVTPPEPYSGDSYIFRRSITD